MIDVTTPRAGFYHFRLRKGAVAGVVEIWHGPPHDPVTGDLLDRSHRWQARFNHEPIEFDRVWPVCAGSPATQLDYLRAIARQEWAREHAPHSAYADPRAKRDPLSEPLPF